MGGTCEQIEGSVGRYLIAVVSPSQVPPWGVGGEQIKGGIGSEGGIEREGLYTEREGLYTNTEKEVPVSRWDKPPHPLTQTGWTLWVRKLLGPSQHC